MSSTTPLIAFDVCICTISSIGINGAGAKQKCSGLDAIKSAEVLVLASDGRTKMRSTNGKPPCSSKNQCGWPAQAQRQRIPRETVTSVLPEKAQGHPLDSQDAGTERKLGYFRKRWACSSDEIRSRIRRASSRKTMGMRLWKTGQCPKQKVQQQLRRENA